MVEVKLKCIECGKEYDENESRYQCDCGGLLDVKSEGVEVSRKMFDSRKDCESGVWRYKELVHPSAEKIISKGEGGTGIYSNEKLDAYAGTKIIAKHEGENPTGSFKDRGMTVGITEALRKKAKVVACASTGNTSASLAAYAAFAGIKCVVFIPEGKIAYGKLSQALAYGARVFQVQGNFDDAMRLVQQAGKEMNMYVLNSVNPWRLEGQKTIVIELINQLGWRTPDWIAVPLGNAGNTSAFGKALVEMKELGLIERMPRIAAIQATGANPLYKTWKEKSRELLRVKEPETIATAIRIGNPVNWRKALRSINQTNGVIEQVTDQEIMDAKAVVDACGIGCEPASAASVAGTKKLVENGVIKRGERVACVLTGNLLKDPDATINYHSGKIEGVKGRFVNKLQTIEPTIEALEKALAKR